MSVCEKHFFQFLPDRVVSLSVLIFGTAIQLLDEKFPDHELRTTVGRRRNRRAASTVRRFLKVKLVDVVGVEHRGWPQQHRPVFAHCAVA